MRRMASIDTDFISHDVSAKTLAGVAMDLGSDPVRYAFMPNGAKPGTSDWHTGFWAAVGVAAILVGPANGGIALAPGDYTIWLAVTDNPQDLRVPVEALTIF
jgi:hypothetical protein